MKEKEKEKKIDTKTDSLEGERSKSRVSQERKLREGCERLMNVRNVYWGKTERGKKKENKSRHNK